MRSLAVKTQRQPLQAIRHQRDVGTAGVGRNEFQLRIVFWWGEEVGRVGVFTGLRPEHHAIDAVLPQDHGSVANLKKARARRPDDRSAKRARQLADLTLAHRRFLLQPRAGLVAPAQDILPQERFDLAAGVQKRARTFHDRPANHVRADVAVLGAAGTIGHTSD